MRQVILNIGVETRGDGLPLTETERERGMLKVKNEAIRRFGGFTVIPVMGAWRDAEGFEFVEDGVQIVILSDLPIELVREHARVVAETAKRELSQQSVLLTIQEADAEFV